MKSLTAVRVSTLVITLILAAIIFIPQIHSAGDFLLGAALGMSIGVQALVWTKLSGRDQD